VEIKDCDMGARVLASLSNIIIVLEKIFNIPKTVPPINRKKFCV
jgi:hypothetical protein